MIRTRGLQPATRAAYDLLQRGCIAMARIEAAGLRIDTAYLDKAIAGVKGQIADTEKALKDSKEWRAWAKQYGNDMKPGSRQQLGHVLFGVLGHPRNPFMGDSNDAAAFEHLKLPFVRDYQNLERLKKALSTNLLGLKRETVDGFTHPFFDLHTAESYRPSSSRINFQNQPVRNKDISEIVRSCVIPRDGNVLLEVDYNTQEVRVSYCYHQDPKLKYDILHGDMHRDRSYEIYLLTPEELGPVDAGMGRLVRYVVKNRFVFAEFYGSVYFQRAHELWDAISIFDLRRADGVSLFEHLKGKGITRLGKCDPREEPEPGTFEEHVKEVERRMWQDNYTVYDRWKKDWWELYKRQGGVNTLTGFRMEGLFRRNQILCDPIQGCLQGHVRVETDRGHVPIKELVGKCVKVWTGFKFVDAYGRAMGKCQLARVTLSSGIVLDCDTRHKFKNQYNQWVDFKDLKVGDCVALPCVPTPVEPLEDAPEFFPFAWGFILGDGCLMERKITPGFTRRYMNITVGERKVSILNDLETLFRGGFNHVRRWEIPAREGRKVKYALSVEDKEFCKLLEKVGFSFSWKAKTKRIPTTVWTYPWWNRRNFMEGLWLSDGSRGVWQERNLHICNLLLLREVQELIAPLGFDSNIRQTKDGWLLRVHENNDRAKPHRKYPREAVLAVAGKIRPRDYDDPREYNSVASAFYRKGATLSQRVGERIIRHADPDAEVYRFDTVENIEVLDEVAETYTMSVDDPLHQFSAGGVICKNSAFHCLLWGIIHIQDDFIRRGMKTKVVCQIHDSTLFDVPRSELSDVIALVKKVFVKDVEAAWDWICVPLGAEFEICGDNWFQKKPMQGV